MFDSLVQIGKTIKPFNVDGLIRVSIDKKYRESLKKDRWIFLDHYNSKVPFQVILLHQKDPIVLRLDDINNRQEAQEISGCKLFMKSEDLIESEVLGNNFEVMIGFEAYTTERERIGLIVEINEYPQQIMASVQGEKVLHLVPLNDQFIQDIQFDKKQCIFSLPEGLLDL